MQRTTRTSPALQHGFTVIELLISIAFLLVAGAAIAFQFNSLRIASQDDARKSAINSMYYALEEVYFKQNGHYPSEITEKTLPSVDPAVLKDKNGNMVGEASSEYRYEPTNCLNGECRGYTLRADLQNESDFVKENR